MGNNMKIRKMIKEDIPQLEILYRLYWNEKSDIEKMKEKFDEINQKNDYIILSAEEGNKLIGSVMGIVCQELYGPCKPFLVVENLVVAKEFQKNGIGKALMREIENYAKEKDCRQIILVTESNREDALAFYPKIGFPKGTNSGFKKKLK